ncbi:ribonuclease J [Dethiosulfatibacter aminovorans DSM 17477]|uniref:Ribonuclease J n=1 Tax=Dethiosulfatibacter aminovorans DSM 17477 TaxID=1121476 RepID=A0A1M6D6P7_9FIRM|nr:ribonuclease J [Dethiosulfatibacter aminovorans]SHI68824.1 ribonuclease J [Dethiosulfatibacter aminovorans DSM 17477]
MQKGNDRKLKLVPLGGMGEIGKNITVLEYGNDIMIVDCGMGFPEDEMLGIDIVIPDISYLIKNKDKIRGVVITHGHEDHIGSIPYLLKKLEVPIYGTKLTIGLIEKKLIEHRLDNKCLHVVNHDDKIKLGCFQAHFIRSNHSIPDASCIAITTPVGVVFHTGDFKVDLTPVKGEPIDLHTIAEYGKKGVLLALSESTNIESPGYSLSEGSLSNNFIELFKKAKKRIVVATFASNVHRVQQIIDAAKIFKRKIVISGRSMVNVIDVATNLGYLDLNPDMIVNVNDINKYKDKELVIISTGSQGEEMAALSRMAADEHRKIELRQGDTVIISASPIPGNEKSISQVINLLYEKNIEVIYDKLYDIHVSGHAKQEEHKLMLALLKPKFFIPVHGEARHLKKHAELAEKMGIKNKNIMVIKTGDMVEITRKEMKLGQKIQSGNILVDGLGVGDVGNIVLRDRKHLSEDGLIIAVVTIDRSSGTVLSGPDIISRGFVYVRENEDLMVDSRAAVQAALEKCFANNVREWSAIKSAIKDELSKFIYSEIKRRPMILPIIMEVRNS